jgi:PAS domain S-box-containing protein
MDSSSVDVRSVDSHAVFLSLVHEVAAEAATQPDPDACLRHLRAGLIRLGFARAGIWVSDLYDPTVFRGTWSTNWDGSEVDEHELVYDIGVFIGAAEILAGGRVALGRVAFPEDLSIPPHQPLVAGEGPPNHATVALRADGQLLGIISVDTLTTGAVIDAEQVAALELIADQVAVAVARWQAVAALRAANQTLLTELGERQRTEQALRHSEELQRSLFTGVPIGLYRTNPAGDILDVNPALSEMLGYAGPNDLYDIKAQDGYVDPEDRVRFRAALERDGVVRRFEMPIRRRDGTVIWIEDSARIVRNADGTIQFYEGSWQDITDRKQAEAALRESEERFRFLAEATGDALYRLRFDSKQYDYMSPAIEKLTGYTVDEINARGFDSIIDQVVSPGGQVMAPDATERQRVAGDVGTYDADYLIRTKHGEPRWLADHAQSWRDSSGNLIGSAGVLSDIGERKRLEEQLRQAQKMEAVGQLAGGVAHDFNNLLTIIAGYGEILRGQPSLNPLQRDAVNQIISAADSAASLTRQLLAFSRRQVVAPKEIDLNAVVEQLAKMLRRVIGEDVAFTMTLAPHLGRVRADPGQIEQVLMNLATNARDAMPNGGTLTIETANVSFDETNLRDHPGARPGSYVLLAVTDSGIGMDQATQAHIFEPFFTTKEVGKGTGLGLAAVYGIVKQSEGSIDVRSEPGCGTTFTMYLPRFANPLPSVTQAPRVERPTGSETILVVEDEQQLRTLARLVLETSGYTVLGAEDGQRALSIAAEYPGQIDLLLTDVVMPGLSGRQIAERLSARQPGLKVLYTSGYTDDVVVRQGIVYSGVEFLQKPFTPTALVQRVRQVLDRQAR